MGFDSQDFTRRPLEYQLCTRSNWCYRVHQRYKRDFSSHMEELSIWFPICDRILRQLETICCSCQGKLGEDTLCSILESFHLLKVLAFMIKGYDDFVFIA